MQHKHFLLVFLLPLAFALPRWQSQTGNFLSAASDDTQYQLKSTWTLSDAAVVSIVPSWPATKAPAAIVTTYHALSSDPVYLLDQAPQTTQLFDSLKWVNQVVQVDADAVPGSPNLLLTAGGFLVPGKTGEVALVDVTDVEHVTVTPISTSKSGWFYHKALTVDINGDGLVDVLAARAVVPTFPWEKKQGELVWFEQPASDPLHAPWKETVLISGPDVSFVFDDIDGDGKKEVVTAQYFTTGEVCVYSCPLALWSDCNATTITQHVIDSSEGPYFNLQFVDMNLDGLKDLLVTNNRADGEGSLFIFEQLPPSSPSSSSSQHNASNPVPNFKKHTLASGYKPISSGMGKGAPGTAFAFHPNATDVSKPWIAMSGDDSGVVVLFQASSQDTSSWDYTSQTIINSTGTVGQLGWGDVDGDGWVDLFVPYYGEGRVEMWSVKQ